MSTTREFKTEDGTIITIRRPSFRAFHRVASKVEALLDVELGAAMGVPEFEEVLRACIQDVNGKQIRALPRQESTATVTDQNGTQREMDTTQEKPDALDAWLEEADYQEAARLWDEIVELGEFIPFYEARQKQYSKRAEEKQKREVKLRANEIRMMKSEGLLRDEFSAEQLILQEMQGQTSLPSSLTGTPAGTAGQETKSSKKTTGSSSGTSRKQHSGGKRSKN